jgi:hypothetical protein
VSSFASVELVDGFPDDGGWLVCSAHGIQKKREGRGGGLTGRFTGRCCPVWRGRRRRRGCNRVPKRF